MVRDYRLGKEVTIPYKVRKKNKRKERESYDYNYKLKRKLKDLIEDIGCPFIFHLLYYYL
jgi:hypothetical protein